MSPINGRRAARYSTGPTNSSPCRPPLRYASPNFPSPGLRILVLLVLLPAQLQAQDSERDRARQDNKIIVTATKLETPAKEVGSSVTVITAQEIEDKQQRTVLDVLRSVPSLNIAQNGGPGGTASVFIRGANSEHTKVLIDGIVMNDPISPARAFDFAHLTTDNIDRIEILYGPQSGLYGSDAFGGVISIITKKGQGEPTGSLSLEGGSFNSIQTRAQVNGGSELFNYSLGFSSRDTDGVSSASEKDGNREQDAYRNDSISTRLGWTPTDTFDVDFFVRYNDTNGEIDNFGGVGGDDPNHNTRSEQLFFRTQLRLSLLDDTWEQRLGFSLSDHDRKDRNDTDADHPMDLSRSSFEGDVLEFDWQHHVILSDNNTVTLGAEAEEERGASSFYSESSFGPFTSNFPKQTARNNGYFVQDHLRFNDDLATTLSARLDDHSRFGSETTYRLAAAYSVSNNATIRGSYGTGFKAPSLFQLFSQFGDPTLNPEMSEGWDFGIEYAIGQGNTALGATLFHNDFESLIQFDGGTSTYINVAEAQADGFELFIATSLTANTTIRADFTSTDTEDKTTGLDLLRRAKEKLGLDVSYEHPDGGNVNLGIVYVGKRYDNDFSSFPATRVQLDEYVLINLAGAYALKDNIRIFGRVENLLDESYEEVRGFGTPGIAAYAGLEFTF